MSAPEILEIPQQRAHLVQLHDGDARILMKNVAHYFAAGLKRRQGAIAIITPKHREVLLVELGRRGLDVEEAIGDSRLILLDAQRTLGAFMIEGEPNEGRFERVIRAAMGRVPAAFRTGLRAYGEMVSILWRSSEYRAAIRLEELWNRLIQTENFTLFCAYHIDIFSPDFQMAGVDALLCDHTRLLATSTDEALEGAINRAMDEHFGKRAEGLRLVMNTNYRAAWGTLPRGEGMILWLRKNLPYVAEDILARARNYHEAERTVPAPGRS